LVPGEGVFDDAQDVALLVAGQLAGALEDLPQLASRAVAAAVAISGSEKLLGGDAEDGGNLFDLLRAEGDFAAFPKGVSGLGDAELVGHLGLGKPRGLAGGVEACAEGGAFELGGSAGLHGRIIRVTLES